MAIETEFAELQPLVSATHSERTTGRKGIGSSLYLVAIYGVLIVAGIIAIVPFLYVVSTSFKDTVALFSYPPKWIPDEPTTINYRNLVNENPFERWLFNSFFVASVVSFPFSSTAHPGGSGLPSRTNCWTRPIATVLVAQSMQIG